ncbi:cupin domain-containing protein [Sediminicoccus sp. KRV36]|uniref:cupin domain-containing protein n=1 Tax=Sediminicoccus sp. KRV36 TaxID=3133721 RepID=UPI00200E1229|nr:cupin domain-containing protein [Sediminicoccus rosea]UPY34924.1 cupin domain-containing protein [Sediminicoccus rosea]
MKRGSLLDGTTAPPGGEQFDALLQSPGLRIERIASTGAASPPGFWYDQPEDEFVLLMAGAAVLRIEGEEPIRLAPGDWVALPAHCRHRVDWTSTEPPAIWLAIHHRSGG